MKVSVLASGSKGNCCYIKNDSTEILIDLGTTCSYIEKSLIGLDTSGNNIQAIFITHTHVDHVDALKVFLKKYKTKVFLTEKMYKELSIELSNFDYIESTKEIGSLKITSFKTSHDTADSCGYLVSSKDRELVYVTDTGYINVKNHKMLENKDMYIMESNHDINMLMNNTKYPYHVKQRILGDKGHLSNEDSSRYLKKLSGSNTKHIVLAHLSEENNTKELAIETLEKKKIQNCEILVADQHGRTKLIEV